MDFVWEFLGAADSRSRAAWVQALLSGLGIFVAALLPLYMRRSQRRADNKRVIAAVGLAEHHASRALDLGHAIAIPQNIQSEIRFWESIRASFGNLAPATVPTPKLLPHLVVVKNILDSQLDALHNVRHMTFLTEETDTELRRNHMVLKEVLSEVRKVR